MTPAEIAALKERAAKFYITAHDSPDIVKLCNYALTLAEQALRLREAARVVVEAFTDPDPTIGEIAVIETLRAALDQAPGDGE